MEHYCHWAATREGNNDIYLLLYTTLNKSNNVPVLQSAYLVDSHFLHLVNSAVRKWSQYTAFYLSMLPLYILWRASLYTTLLKTLDSALGIPRETEPNVTKTARLVLGARDERPMTVPRKESGSSCGDRNHFKYIKISKEHISMQSLKIIRNVLFHLCSFNTTGGHDQSHTSYC